MLLQAHRKVCLSQLATLFPQPIKGGYNLERVWVNEVRFVALVLLIAIAYTLATFDGEFIQQMSVRNYVCHTTDSTRSVERHSHFWIGLYGQLWVDSMADFADLMMQLVSLKPHKRLNYQQGLHGGNAEFGEYCTLSPELNL